MRTLSTTHKHFKLRVLLRKYLPNFERITTGGLGDAKEKRKKIRDLTDLESDLANKSKIHQEISTNGKILQQLQNDLQTYSAEKWKPYVEQDRWMAYKERVASYTNDDSFLLNKTWNVTTLTGFPSPDNVITTLEKTISQYRDKIKVLNNSVNNFQSVQEKLSFISKLESDGEQIRNQIESASASEWIDRFNSYFKRKEILGPIPLLSFNQFLDEVVTEKKRLQSEFLELDKNIVNKSDRNLLIKLETLKKQRQEAEADYIRSAQPLNWVDRFTFDIENSYQDYYVFDLTQFVSSYETGNTIDQRTSNWSITFENKVLDLQDVVFRNLLVETEITKLNKGYKNPSSNKFINRLAQYNAYTDTTNLENDRDFFTEEQSLFEEALSKYFQQLSEYRGEGPGYFIRISDLIQPMDFLTCEISETNAIEETNIAEAELSGVDKGRVFNYEFVGFVKEKSKNDSVGSNSTVTIGGGGPLVLSQQTRRVYESSLLRGTIFDFTEISDLALNEKETQDLQQVSVFQYLHQDKTPIQIFEANLRWIFRIHNNNMGDKISMGAKTPYYFVDEALIKTEVALSRNIFAIPSLLYAWFMREQGTACKHFKVESLTDEVRFLTEIRNDVKKRLKNPAKDDSLQKLWNEKYKKELEQYTTITPPSNAKRNFVSEPLLISDVGNLAAYFKQFGNLNLDWNVETKTPFEVIDEVLGNTFLELIELPDGRFWIRGPKYNIDDYTTTKTYVDIEEGFGAEINDEAKLPIDLLIASHDSYHKDGIDIISTTFSEDISKIRSKQKLKFAFDYGMDFKFNVSYYTNGKILSQFGLNESDTFTNPNLRSVQIKSNTKQEDENLNLNRKVRNAQIARYLLNLNNVNTRTGTIRASGSPRFVLGNCYFDTHEKKFGYIVGYTKNVGVGQTYTMTLTLNFVRDAYEVLEGLKNTIKTMRLGKFAEYMENVGVN